MVCGVVMARANTIFESAHKGDFDLVRNKLEEDPSLLTKVDEVSTNKSCAILCKTILEQPNFVALVFSRRQLKTSDTFNRVGVTD